MFPLGIQAPGGVTNLGAGRDGTRSHRAKLNPIFSIKKKKKALCKEQNLQSSQDQVDHLLKNLLTPQLSVSVLVAVQAVFGRLGADSLSTMINLMGEGTDDF